MRHVILMCKNHPNLRWSCKEVAFTPGYGYNGCRNIFFNGISKKDSDGNPLMFSDKSGLDCTFWDPETGREILECDCGPCDLILAPEDALVAR